MVGPFLIADGSSDRVSTLNFQHGCFRLMLLFESQRSLRYIFFTFSKLKHRTALFGKRPRPCPPRLYLWFSPKIFSKILQKLTCLLDCLYPKHLADMYLGDHSHSPTRNRATWRGWGWLMEVAKMNLIFPTSLLQELIGSTLCPLQ